jgi:hypothetical protein
MADHTSLALCSACLNAFQLEIVSMMQFTINKQHTASEQWFTSEFSRVYVPLASLLNIDALVPHNNSI